MSNNRMGRVVLTPEQASIGIRFRPDTHVKSVTPLQNGSMMLLVTHPSLSEVGEIVPVIDLEKIGRLALDNCAKCGILCWDKDRIEQPNGKREHQDCNNPSFRPAI